MPTITGLSLITDAFSELNVLLPNEAPSANDAQFGLRALNRMLGQWALQSFTIPAVARVTTPAVVGQGSTANPYTIGIGGTINVPRPPSQAAIVGVGLLLNNSTPPVEIPRALLTDDAYQGIPVKDLTNSLFTGLYYNPTVPLGTINLWPVTSVAGNTLVLYLQQALSAFVDLTTVYSVQDGAEEALYYNLAKRLIVPYGRAGSQVAIDITQMAGSSLMILKRANVKMSDLANDFAYGPAVPGGHGYDIQTGNL